MISIISYLTNFTVGAFLVVDKLLMHRVSFDYSGYTWLDIYIGHHGIGAIMMIVGAIGLYTKVKNK